jgi:hypothetical protein
MISQTHKKNIVDLIKYCGESCIELKLYTKNNDKILLLKTSTKKPYEEFNKYLSTIYKIDPFDKILITDSINKKNYNFEKDPWMVYLIIKGYDDIGYAQEGRNFMIPEHMVNVRDPYFHGEKTLKNNNNQYKSNSLSKILSRDAFGSHNLYSQLWKLDGTDNKLMRHKLSRGRLIIINKYV